MICICGYRRTDGHPESELSRLENDVTSIPIILALERYAVGLGLKLPAELLSSLN